MGVAVWSNTGPLKMMLSEQLSQHYAPPNGSNQTGVLQEETGNRCRRLAVNSQLHGMGAMGQRGEVGDVSSPSYGHKASKIFTPRKPLQNIPPGAIIQWVQWCIKGPSIREPCQASAHNVCPAKEKICALL